MSVLVQFKGRDKVYSGDATSSRMYSTIALFFITRQGALMVLPYNLAISSLTCGFYPAVSCHHLFNNSEHRFCNTFHAAPTDTNTKLLRFWGHIQWQILVKCRFLSPLALNDGALTFGKVLYFYSLVLLYFAYLFTSCMCITINSAAEPLGSLSHKSCLFICQGR